MLDILKETGMLGCKPVNTLMDPNIKLENKIDSAPFNKERYKL